MKLLCVLVACFGLLSAGETPAWELRGQATVVAQGHGAFPSPYRGPNSLDPEPERASSFTGTLMAGWRPAEGLELRVDLEGAAGRGVSDVLGLAGAPNGETYRVGDPGLRLSLARALLRKTWELGGEAPAEHPEGRAARRIVLHFGKFSAMDLFDDNAYAHEPRTQFLNWTLMGHGAWDYPADTRGYTWGAALELA